MTMPPGEAEALDWRDEVTAEITRRATAYVRALTASQDAGSVRQDEAGHLVRVELFTAELLEQHSASLTAHRGYTLTFRQLYQPVGRGTADTVSLVAALLAAEVERAGPLRLSRAQTQALARTYEELGSHFRAAALLQHAAMCNERAAALHGEVQDHEARDRCLFEERQARYGAMPAGFAKAAEWFNGAVTGYGYRPYRFLLFIVAELVAFSLAVCLTARQPVVHAAYLVLGSYINPMGPGDMASLPDAGKTLLITASYVGLVSTSVFFALLVRRWFRD